MEEKKQTQRRKVEWFRKVGAVVLTDTVGAALLAMQHVQSSRAFVLTPDGALVGVVSLNSICYELLKMELQCKNLEMVQCERHS